MKTLLIIILLTTTSLQLAKAGTVSTYPNADGSNNIIVSDNDDPVFFYVNCENGAVDCFGNFENGSPPSGDWGIAPSETIAVTFGDDAEGLSNTCSLEIYHANSTFCSHNIFTYQVIVPSIQISANNSGWQNIDEVNQNVCPGEQINLQVCAPGLDLSTYTFTWLIEGITFDQNGYSPPITTDSAMSSVSVPSALTNSELTNNQYLTYFYAFATGAGDVSCTMTDSSHNSTLISALLNVEPPTGTFSATSNGAGAIKFYQLGALKFFGDGDGLRRTFSTAGITFNTTGYTAPADMPGVFQLVQTITSIHDTELYHNRATSPSPIAMDHVSLLDTEFPVINPWDYPGDRYNTAENLDVITRSESFKDTLLFLPDSTSASYVPVSSFTWSFSDSASKPTITNGVYSGKLTKTSGTPPGSPTGSPPSTLADFPNWTASF